MQVPPGRGEMCKGCDWCAVIWRTRVAAIILWLSCMEENIRESFAYDLRNWLVWVWSSCTELYVTILYSNSNWSVNLMDLTYKKTKCHHNTAISGYFGINPTDSSRFERFHFSSLPTTCLRPFLDLKGPNFIHQRYWYEYAICLLSSFCMMLHKLVNGKCTIFVWDPCFSFGTKW